MIASAFSVTGLIAAGAAFVILWVILGVHLWISLLVTAGVLALTAILSGGAAAARERQSREHRQFG